MSLSNKDLSHKDACLLLNGLGKLGPVSIRRLLNGHQNDPRKILCATRSSLLSVEGVGPAMADSILDGKKDNWLQKEKAEMERRGMEFLTEEDYPELLRQIYDPPVGLYLKGKVPKNPCIGVVGTRQPSLYGQRLCHEIASALAEAGFCIVSGMARGIDSIAHKAALSVGGETIAFLGCGLDIIYPPENLNLYLEISEKGGVFSEFPLGRKADRRTFPMRNRLVSGISSATIVIESAASGGSLISAQFAAEQGRLVFALPGRVDQPESAGCHQLIRDGAILVRNVQDILDEMENSFLCGMTFSRKSTENPLQNEREMKSPQIKNFIPEEREVFSILEDGACLSLEEIFERVSLEFSKLSSTLSMMEINGVLEKRSDGKFELK
ncbi:MAG: DNA-protecting protein DprA [Opitutales bacterium]|nr:DNA-protecting protein DprA [Opitutales bacterium]